ncbi:site-specific integrase [Achromobacter xylosoxidans]
MANLAATLAVATIERRLIGIHRAHQDQNLTSPAVHVSVRQTMQGIRRTLGITQRRVRAIVKDDLLEMLALVDQQKPMRAARDRALLLIGFAGAFRRAELVAIQYEDITAVDEGIEILLRRSKTDQEGVGRTVFIPRAKGTRCPVAAIDQWTAASGIGSGYIFRKVTRHDTVGSRPLTGQSVALILKAAYRRAGGNAGLVAGHSLRAGYVTAAAMAGLQPFQIQQQTGHRSTTTLARYIRSGRAAKNTNSIIDDDSFYEGFLVQSGTCIVTFVRLRPHSRQFPSQLSQLLSAGSTHARSES